MAPVLSGKKLIALLQKDGWSIGRKAKHGVTLFKSFGKLNRVTFIPDTRADLPVGTLLAILGHMQTGIGRKGLDTLINKYGI